MEFKLNIDEQKFRSTNSAWNKLKLNSPWSVGYVTTLIESKIFKIKEEWEEFYYESGEKRIQQLMKLPLNLQQILQNELNEVEKLDSEIKNLNFQYGRTQNELKHKGKILYENVKNNGFNLSEEECYECVRFRVICETWNGVIVRENNTIQTLINLFPTLEFKKTNGEVDYTYAVDYEVHKDKKLVMAIQIKPKSYTWNMPYIKKARETNKYKNRLYTEKFSVPVIDVISKANGEVLNKEVLDYLKQFS